MTSISILWSTLDPTVQQWLLHNPGTLVLPRTYVNRVETGTGQDLSLGKHGEHWLSSEEMLFLHTKRSESTPTGVAPMDITTQEAGRSGQDSLKQALDQ